MNFSFLPKYLPYFVQGTLSTLIISALTVVFGSIIGMIVALLKLSKSRILRVVTSAYIEIIRGTPAMLQVMICHLVLSRILPLPEIFIGNLDLSRVIPGCIALSLNSGAYVAEIVRSGISAINIGQTEAAYSLGMRPWKTMRYIILPQAIRNILPALGNEFVTIIKESSVLSVIGITELLFSTGIVTGATFIALEPLYLAAAIYFVLTFTTSRVISYFEGKMSKGVRK